jgi:hypothetical protein
MKFQSKRNNTAFDKLILTVFLIFPLLLYLIPLEWFCKQHSVCIIKNIFDIECYGCGITRAVLYGLHFDIQKAINYNKMVVIVFPILIYIWTKTLLTLYKTI